MSDVFTELAHELDAESWAWLSENHALIADAVALAVKRGATPEAVRAYVLRRVGSNRQEFAKRCEAASRYLHSVKS